MFRYTNGVIQTLTGIGAGYIMLATGRYKWMAVAGCVLRTVGYGIMIRLRGQYNTYAEIFIQQCIQGAGSGIIQTVLLVPPQIVVPHSQVAQVLALIFSLSYLGSSVGSAIAGSIYTNLMRPDLWNALGSSGTAASVDALYNSIASSLLPDWGTVERTAINSAVSDDIQNMPFNQRANQEFGPVLGRNSEHDIHCSRRFYSRNRYVFFPSQPFASKVSQAYIHIQLCIPT
jgi:hypothetical protein